MTTTEQNQPLDTHLIPWPLLKDVLKGVLLRIETEVWYRNFEGAVNAEEVEERDPGMLDNPNMSMQQALAAVPNLRDLLDQALGNYEVPGYIGNELEHACEAAIEKVTGGLTRKELGTLEALAQRAIRNGSQEEPEILDSHHLLSSVTTQDVIESYQRLRETARRDGHNIPAWPDLPQDGRIQLVEACRNDLAGNPRANFTELLQFALDWTSTG